MQADTLVCSPMRTPILLLSRQPSWYAQLHKGLAASSSTITPYDTSCSDTVCKPVQWYTSACRASV